MQFKKIYIEITNTCNLSCSFCIQNQRTPQRMSVSQFTHVIQQIHPYTNYVYLHVLGEPLSHPELKEILAVCEQYQMQVNLTTNGTLLKQQESVLYASALRQINISLHSFPQHYQVAYLQDCVHAGKRLAEKKTYVSYRLWNMQQGALSSASCDMITYLNKAYGRTFEDLACGTYRLADYTFLHIEETFAWPSLAHPYVNDIGSCLGMKQMCGILSDGSVVPCCLDSKAEALLGNIFETPFSSIVTSDRVTSILEGFQRRQVREPLCQHCSYRQRFDTKKKAHNSTNSFV